MITVGSVSREAAAARFPFLAAKVSGRRNRIKEFTHRDPDFVFWVYPDGRLHDAKQSHRDNVPRGYKAILDDEPDYGGFLRGRVASLDGDQLVVVYCRPEALTSPGEKLTQFLRGLSQLPVPLDDGALVVSDNADLYGTVADLYQRAEEADSSAVADTSNRGRKMAEKRFALRADQIRPLAEGRGGCYATDAITVEGHRVGYMYREAPDFDVDSGWRFLS